MRIIKNLRKRISYEARILKWIRNHNIIMDTYIRMLGNSTKFISNYKKAITEIKSDLILIKQNKKLYRERKNKYYKSLIKEALKNIKKNKKFISFIINQNHTYYMNLIKIGFSKSR
jgi:hypothetical protein